MKHLGTIYRMKEDSIGSPSIYLGANVKEWTVQDEFGKCTTCYVMGSSSYVKESIRIVENLMEKHDISHTSTRRNGRSSPFSSADYRPELDSTECLNDELMTVFQNLMGMLRWICELGWIDIIHESTLLSQYMIQPRVGHLNQALRKYLNI